MGRKRAGIIGLVMILVMLTASCSRDRKADSATSGNIIVYSNIILEQLQEYIVDFQTKYPDIKVTLVRDTLGSLVERLYAERNKPEADVLWGLSLTTLVLMEWRDMLSPYAPAGLDRIQSSFRDVSKPPHWVGLDAWISAFCVNMEKLKQYQLPLPLSWYELADPVYKGHIVGPNPVMTGTGYMAVSAVLQLYGEVEGWEYLDHLHENIVNYVPSGSKPCRMASAGEATIGISYGLPGLDLKNRGSPIEVIFPTEGSGWDMEASALVKKENIKPAAKTFLDWAISDSAMRGYAKNWAVTAVKTNVIPPAGFPDQLADQMLDRDFPWSIARRESILKEWERRYVNKVMYGPVGTLGQQPMGLNEVLYDNYLSGKE